MDRWISADIVTLGSHLGFLWWLAVIFLLDDLQLYGFQGEGENVLSGWPLPNWVQKEIDVYPCIPGEVPQKCRDNLLSVSQTSDIALASHRAAGTCAG